MAPFLVGYGTRIIKEGDALKDPMKPDRLIVGSDDVRTAKRLETLYAPVD
jgi:UDPglucose 6-dehydrogenase